MGILDNIIEKFGNLGFKSKTWENLEGKSVYDVILQEKTRFLFLYPSFFSFKYFGDINSQNKPEKFVYISKFVIFYDDSKFTRRQYKNFLEKVKTIVRRIREKSIPFMYIKNENPDFSYIGFLFPIN